MSEFIIRPHGRLHDWIADAEGYFTAEGLEYRLATDARVEHREKPVDPQTGALCEVRSGAYELYQEGKGAKGTEHSDVSCACHWTVNEAAAQSSGRMWANAYSVVPGAIMVRDTSSIRTPADLAGVPVSVGYRSGSHYATIQALEPFLKPEQIELKFHGTPWARVDAAVDGDVPATMVWGPALYACEQLGMRKIVDASFMGAFMMPPPTPISDLERYFRALRRAQIDIDLAPERYKHHFSHELPPRYRDRVDVRLFGPGERVVFLPYTRATFATTQRWIHERGIFETAAVCDYESAIVAAG